MSIESIDYFLVLLDERIRKISKEVAAELVGQSRQSSDPLIEDSEAANIQKALQRIMVTFATWLIKPGTRRLHMPSLFSI
jgi:hypothetical protein